jgi:hypothetical protein
MDKANTYPLGKPRKFRVTAYCPRSNTVATNEEAHELTADGAGWKCPACGRVLMLCRQNPRGYRAEVRPRWPRHYAAHNDPAKGRAESASSD